MGFPAIKRTVTAEMVTLYGRVNHDRNMIHYDNAVAREAGFPKAVAHGAITAAVMDEACRAHFGEGWLRSGRLDVKFVKPFYVGDTMSTHGTEAAPGVWDVWCEDGEGGKVLLGQAALEDGG